jgi:hypothetical protein
MVRCLWSKVICATGGAVVKTPRGPVSRSGALESLEGQPPCGLRGSLFLRTPILESAKRIAPNEICARQGQRAEARSLHRASGIAASTISTGSIGMRYLAVATGPLSSRK